jgi:IS30 family transposase
VEHVGLAKALGHWIGTITRSIGRPKSTISRELSHNSLRGAATRHFTPPEPIQLRRRHEALIERDRAFPIRCRPNEWSPEQIPDCLKLEDERRLRAMGRETIDAFMYQAAPKGQAMTLSRRHKRRRPRRSRPLQDTIKDRVSIHEQPIKVDARVAGYWEGCICQRTRLLFDARRQARRKHCG